MTTRFGAGGRTAAGSACARNTVGATVAATSSTPAVSRPRTLAAADARRVGSFGSRVSGRRVAGRRAGESDSSHRPATSQPLALRTEALASVHSRLHHGASESLKCQWSSCASSNDRANKQRDTLSVRAGRNPYVRATLAVAAALLVRLVFFQWLGTAVPLAHVSCRRGRRRPMGRSGAWACTPPRFRRSWRRIFFCRRSSISVSRPRFSVLRSAVFCVIGAIISWAS